MQALYVYPSNSRSILERKTLLNFLNFLFIKLGFVIIKAIAAALTKRKDIKMAIKVGKRKYRLLIPLPPNSILMTYYIILV